MPHPRRGGPLGRALLLAALAPCVLPAAAQAAILDELSGSWAAEASGPPAMEWAATDDGFTVSWTPPGAEATTVRFALAGRPGVYAGEAKASRSMMDAMFGEAEPVNPLESGELFWARTAEDGVYLYSLAIEDDGAPQITRYHCRPGEGSLDVSVQRRTADETSDAADQRLVRVGR